MELITASIQKINFRDAGMVSILLRLMHRAHVISSRANRPIDWIMIRNAVQTIHIKQFDAQGRRINVYVQSL